MQPAFQVLSTLNKHSMLLIEPYTTFLFEYSIILQSTDHPGERCCFRPEELWLELVHPHYSLPGAGWLS